MTDMKLINQNDTVDWEILEEKKKKWEREGWVELEKGNAWNFVPGNFYKYVGDVYKNNKYFATLFRSGGLCVVDTQDYVVLKSGLGNFSVQKSRLEWVMEKKVKKN